MKWEDPDINVVEQGNIPKFSKVDNIGASLRLFELFYDNALIDMIVGYTMLYDHGEKQTLVLKLLMKHFAYFRHATA